MESVRWGVDREFPCKLGYAGPAGDSLPISPPGFTAMRTCLWACAKGTMRRHFSRCVKWGLNQMLNLGGVPPKLFQV